MVDLSLQSFGIASKVRYLITDNASNMRKAFTVQMIQEEVPEEVDEELDDNELWEDHVEIDRAVAELSRGRVRLSCFAHTLQLAIGDGLKVSKLMENKMRLTFFTIDIIIWLCSLLYLFTSFVVKQVRNIYIYITLHAWIIFCWQVNNSMRGALGKASKMTSLLHTSTTFKEVFSGTFGNRTLRQPNSTRWNSTLDHVSAAVNILFTVSAFLHIIIKLLSLGSVYLLT